LANVVQDTRIFPSVVRTMKTVTLQYAEPVGRMATVGGMWRIWKRYFNDVIKRQYVMKTVITGIVLPTRTVVTESMNKIVFW